MSKYDLYIRVDYDGDDPDTYRGMYATSQTGNTRHVVADTGDIQHDLRTVKARARTHTTGDIHFSDSLGKFLQAVSDVRQREQAQTAMDRRLARSRNPKVLAEAKRAYLLQRGELSPSEQGHWEAVESFLGGESWQTQ